jgi:hypothetical protein
VQPGGRVTLQLRASDQDSVKTLGYVASGGGWADSARVNLSPMADTVVHTFTITVPTTVPAGASIVITPVATDKLNEPGSGSSVLVSVRASNAGDTQGPIVTQLMPSNGRVEADDAITILADDREGTPVDSIKMIVLSEVTGAQIDSALADLTSDANATPIVSLALQIPPAYVGQKVIIKSCAWDRSTNRNVGCNVRSGITTPAASYATAKPDTVLVVHGRTFPLTNGGTVGDITVDTIRHRVYLSNMTFDRIDVWQNSTQQFASTRIAVGADPWGMHLRYNPAGDTLLVANSGGTNISRVPLGGTGAAIPSREDPNSRIKTPNTYIAEIELAVDGSGLARMVQTNWDFSDRPQYVVQTQSGDIYYSTKPTPSAPPGTIRRYLESSRAWGAPQPEAQQIWDYAEPGEPGKVSVGNADYVAIRPGSQFVSDSLVICDRVMNTTTQLPCARGTDPASMAASLRSLGSDVWAAKIDVESLALTDTTFVAVSGDGHWVAFGEAHTDSAGRVMMAEDLTDFFSPGINVADLVNNASERVFGLALNKDGSTAAAHGMESYFFDVENPFHLRLQGKVNTFDVGAGIAFHPDNDASSGSNASTRLGFVASANGTIEIVDTYHYTARGQLPVRASLYGPIRVTRSFPTDNAGVLPSDPNYVVLKIFGLTKEGLIVIDVRNRDILSIP